MPYRPDLREKTEDRQGKGTKIQLGEKRELSKGERSWELENEKQGEKRGRSLQKKKKKKKRKAWPGFRKLLSVTIKKGGKGIPHPVGKKTDEGSGRKGERKWPAAPAENNRGASTGLQIWGARGRKGMIRQGGGTVTALPLMTNHRRVLREVRMKLSKVITIVPL